MARSNGGIIGKVNKTSFGKCVVTSKTASGDITAQPGTTIVQATTVAGGGGGAGRGGGGGGGGGGVVCEEINASGTIAVVIGGGGAGGNPNVATYAGSPGTVTTVAGCSSAIGGGGGGSGCSAGLPGGSGGGEGRPGSPGIGTGTAGQGNNGGSQTNCHGGGGGGAGAVGGNAPSCQGGAGGAGSSSISSLSCTVFAGGGFCNVENHGANTPEQVLGSVADAMANYGCITLGQSAVVLAPEHVRIINRAGWSREQVKEYLFTQAYRTVEGLKSVGKFRQREYNRQHDNGGTSPLLLEGQLHRGLTPDDILLVVGGGDAGGHSCFIPSWSRARASLMQSKPIGVCIDCD